MAGQELRRYAFSFIHHISKGLIYDQFAGLSSILPFDLEIE